MRKTILTLSIILATCGALAHAQAVFKKYGFNKKPLTLSKGKYNEFFTNDEVVQIGTVRFNTRTNKVIQLLEEDTTKNNYLSDRSSIWYSVDPLAEKYPNYSPYVYCMNNPVNFIDPDGRWVKGVSYGKDGTLVFSKEASKSTIRMCKALSLNDNGKSMLKFAINSDINVKMKMVNNEKSISHGTTLQGNNNPKDNYGRVVNPDGTYGIKEATVSVNEAELKNAILNPKSEHYGQTLEEAIGATTGHEIVHGTNKSEINKDIKSEINHTKRTDGEVIPEKVEQKIINETKQSNKKQP